MKICHLTSAHASDDVRIFLKECCSLAKAGYDVYLVAKGESREDSGVHVVGLGDAPGGRRERMTAFAKKTYERALALNCDVYHFHDPELLPYGLKLKKAGKTVVFDAHENVAGQIMDKSYIPVVLRSIVSNAYHAYESRCVSRLDAVVAATPYIAGLFTGRAQKVCTVCNYPRLDDIVFQQSPFEKRGRVVCYAGGINESRGEHTMLELAKQVDAEFRLAGPFDGDDPARKSAPENVRYLGVLDRTGVNALYGASRAGLILLKKTPNYLDSLPVKMFEYMAAGLPYVASDFPLWREITEKADCGICVDPLDQKALRDAVFRLVDDPVRAQQMGIRGREAVTREYNWKRQEETLLRLYDDLARA